MAIPLKTRLGIWWLLRNRAAPQTQILGVQGQTPEKVLILLSADEDVARVARHFIRRTSWVGNPGIHFLSESGGEEYYSFLKAQLSSWKESDLSRWGLLKPEIVSQILHQPFDAVINLDPRPSPVWVDLIRHSTAWLKIGFDFPGSSRLYNVMLSVKNGAYVERGYQTIRQLVGLIRDKKTDLE
ncbi:MAG: hypothetical protein GXO90_01100 [FCB group bacterium]|nr:hypothetical protein [FCB group bacterium]